MIGSGPGGYVAAIKAAQLGMKVLCLIRQIFLSNLILFVIIPGRQNLHSCVVNHLSKVGNF